MLHTVFSLTLCALIGYLSGCSNMALYVSKLKKIDLRKTGSRNLGTGNTYLTFGLGWSLLVFIHDAGKSALAIRLCQRLYPNLPTGLYVAGAATVIGHIYPFYLRFRGGKGFAAYLGMILTLNRRAGIIAILSVTAIALITNHFVIASAATVIVYPVYIALTTHSIGAVAAVSLASIVFLWLHRQNFVRLAKGTEPKILDKCSCNLL